MYQGFTVWFTGLPSAGKTTLAGTLSEALRARGVDRLEILDGDVVRENLSKGLGFSREDRDINIRRIGFVCQLLTRNGVPNIAAAISPYRQVREEVRHQIGRFVEVFVHCPVEECIKRDVKGLYAKALKGEIKGFTGVDDPYEDPLAAEVVVETARETPEQSTNKIIARLEELGFIGRRADSGAYTPQEETKVAKRLEDLGYM